MPNKNCRIHERLKKVFLKCSYFLKNLKRAVCFWDLGVRTEVLILFWSREEGNVVLGQGRRRPATRPRASQGKWCDWELARGGVWAQHPLTSPAAPLRLVAVKCRHGNSPLWLVGSKDMRIK